jgi:hypothetical protein
MPDPTAVFLAQVDAFNAADLEAFLATYADDAVVNGVGPEPLVGKAALRELYAARFQQRPLRCEVGALHAIGGRWAVAHERVTGPTGTNELVAVFEVADGVIVRADMSARHPVG